MKIKQIILTIAFSFATLLINAQDKYEFMNINYTSTYKLAVSIDGKEFSIEKIDLPKNESHEQNANPFLLKVKEYQDKGWEVMTLDTQVYGDTGFKFAYSGYLRKKKN